MKGMSFVLIGWDVDQDVRCVWVFCLCCVVLSMGEAYAVHWGKSELGYWKRRAKEG
jgi:hypothetical protein